MKDANTPNEPGSAKVSPIEPNRLDTSEADYLDRQVKNAQAAIRETLGDIARTAGEAADVRSWTRQFPLAALGAAVVAGFAAAAAVTPTKDQSLEDKFRELSDKLAEAVGRSHTVEVVEDSGRPSNAEHAEKRSGGWLGKLLVPLTEIAKTAIATSLSTAMAQRHDAASNGDGSAANSSGGWGRSGRTAVLLLPRINALGACNLSWRGFFIGVGG